MGPVRDDEPLLPVLQACRHGTPPETALPRAPGISTRVPRGGLLVPHGLRPSTSWSPRPGPGPAGSFAPALSLGPEAEALLRPGHLAAVPPACLPSTASGAHLPVLPGWQPSHCLPASCSLSSPGTHTLPCRMSALTVLILRTPGSKSRLQGSVPESLRLQLLASPVPSVREARCKIEAVA